MIEKQEEPKICCCAPSCACITVGVFNAIAAGIYVLGIAFYIAMIQAGGLLMAIGIFALCVVAFNLLGAIGHFMAGCCESDTGCTIACVGNIGCIVTWAAATVFTLAAPGESIRIGSFASPIFSSFGVYCACIQKGWLEIKPKN